MNNTIPNVPRELEPCPFCGGKAHAIAENAAKRQPEVVMCLACLGEIEGAGAIDKWNARTLSAQSPAGVDGLEVVSNWVLFDAKADKPYIKKMLPEGFLAFFDCEEDARRAKANNPGTDYKRIDRVKADDAQAIIDGLRGENERIRLNIAEYNEAIACYQSERDKQARRIGELEGLLRSCLPALSDGGCAALANRIDAAISAGNEGE